MSEGPNYAALASMDQQQGKHDSHAAHIPSTEGGEMSGPKYGGQVDLGAVSGSLSILGGADMSEMFGEINNQAALGSLEIQDALNTIGPTTTEGLKYANDYHNANLGHNVGAQNIGLPGATESKGAVGVPRG